MLWERSRTVQRVNCSLYNTLVFVLGGSMSRMHACCPVLSCPVLCGCRFLLMLCGCLFLWSRLYVCSPPSRPCVDGVWLHGCVRAARGVPPGRRRYPPPPPEPLLLCSVLREEAPRITVWKIVWGRGKLHGQGPKQRQGAGDRQAVPFRFKLPRLSTFVPCTAAC